MRIRTVFITLTAAFSLIGLAACSNGDGEADFNKADVSFAQDMIPHHRQATEMAAMAESHTENADVRELASKITAAQQPEIDLMSGWLKSWGEEVPDEEMSGMDHSNGMPGMMSSEDMAALEESSGDDFDQMFLTMMIEHHEGAIEAAKTEEEEGKFADAIELARRIQKDQAAEIRSMEALLKS